MLGGSTRFPGRQTSGPAPAAAGLGLFLGQAGVARGCMCLCVSDKFSNKGPTLLLCGPPASLHLFAGVARGPPTRPGSDRAFHSCRMAHRSPRDTHGWHLQSRACIHPSL